MRALVVLLVLCGTASAQIVNVQGALAKAPPADGAAGEVSLKISWREGNNPLFDIGGSAVVLGRRGRVLGLALARGEYGRSRGLTFTEKTFEHLRTRITLDCHWRWEVFGQHELDRFRRLSFRAVAGTGPAFQVFDTETFGMLVGAAYLFEVERLDNREGAMDAGREDVTSRASIYVTGHEDLTRAVSIVQTVYVQPRILEPSDLRVLGELALQHKLSKHIALKDSLVIAYDDSPPDLVKRFDSSLELALLVSF